MMDKTGTIAIYDTCSPDLQFNVTSNSVSNRMKQKCNFALNDNSLFIIIIVYAILLNADCQPLINVKAVGKVDCGSIDFKEATPSIFPVRFSIFCRRPLSIYFL
jgi:hypothetical protein